ncbi:hypothetical protein H6G00_05145 [Leptolyngbya sp. FACHB-541]|uniref:hypothetical protein n=1 Tax=Leptolyngbya sp. FACHB-541 TaxID=2692810 RepID=UPI001687632E|nr:hypothetical protein [Leptolyngbya sp. FACHB-541]MBD1996002.1 hypothetical protein [Leptolyngbya sp. FACHB-541]
MEPLEGVEVSGQLALLMGNAIRQQDLELLREVIREIAVSLDDLNAKWIFRVTGLDLSPEQQQWFEGAIAQIRNRTEDSDYA